MWLVKDMKIHLASVLNKQQQIVAKVVFCIAAFVLQIFLATLVALHFTPVSD